MKAAAALFLSLFLLPQEPGKPPAPLPPAPRLAVLLSVDQMRADYLDRFRPLFRGGFKRLLEEGAVFSNCTLDYSCTETGPGHATLATGRNPRSHGIVGNTWFDRSARKQVDSAEDSDAKPVGGGSGGSPKNLLATTLGDWLRGRFPGAKVVSIAGKDRSAILLGGKKPTAALWYAAEAVSFVSSSYYGAELPSWLKAWEKQGGSKAFGGRKWERLLPTGKYRECGATEDEAKGEWLQGFNKKRFPYELSSGGKNLGDQLRHTPFLDELTLSLARAAVDGERLGMDDEPDLLCLGLSALDFVGHGCGPHSQEAADVVLRLDGMLGEFLSFLERKVGKGNFVVALSADHGVAPLVEWSAAQGKAARRAGRDATEAIRGIQEALRKKFGEGDWLLSIDFGGAYVDWDRCRRKQVDAEEVAGLVVLDARKHDFVESAFFARQVRKPDGMDPLLDLFSNAFFQDRCPDVFFVAKEEAYVSTHVAGTGHGTPWLHDRAVPLLLWGDGIVVSRREEPVHPTALAPTLAEFLGVPPPQDLAQNSLIKKLPK